MVSLDGTQVYLNGYGGANYNFAHVTGTGTNQVIRDAGPVLNGEPGVRSQEKFLELARANAIRREPTVETPTVQVTHAKPIRRTRKGGRAHR